MKDQSGRLSGYGFHGDSRDRRKRTRQAAEADDINPVCDHCGKRNAKQAGNWLMLCLECREEADRDDEDGYGYSD